VKRADLERAVGDTIRDRWMNEEAMARLRAEAIAEREKMLGSTDGARANLKTSLKRTEVQIKRIVDAIADTGHNKSLVERLQVLQAEGDRLKAELASLDDAVAPDPAEITDDIEAKILAAAAEIENLLNDPSRPDALRAREMVRSMIERITVTRHESGVTQINVRGAFAGYPYDVGRLSQSVRFVEDCSYGRQ